MESIFAHLDLNVVGLLWHGANFLLLLAAIVVAVLPSRSPGCSKHANIGCAKA